MGDLPVKRRELLRSASIVALGSTVPGLADAVRSSRLRWRLDRGDQSVRVLAAEAGRLYLRYDDTLEVLTNLDDADRVRTLWKRSGLNQVVVDGDIICVGDGSRTYRVDARTGDTVWAFDGGDPVAIDAGTVYIGRSGTECYAVATSDGSERWTFDVGLTGHTFKIHGNTAFVVDLSTVTALDADTGTRQWTTSPGNEDAEVESPVVGERFVYVRADGAVHAIDRTTGDVVWTAAQSIVPSRPLAEVNGTLYVSGLYDAALVSFQPTNGGSSTDAGQTTAPLPPNKVFALDATTGEQKWRQTGVTRPEPPIETDRTLYLPSSEALHALDPADGTERWSIDAASIAGPALVNGTVYVGTGTGTSSCETTSECVEGVLYALDNDGSEQWTYESATGPVTAPVTSNGSLFAGTWDGSVLAFDIGEPAGPASPEIDLSVTGATTTAGESVTVEFEVENFGGPTDRNRACTFQLDGESPGSLDGWGIEDTTADRGAWDAFAWLFGRLGRGESTTGTVRLRVGDDVPPGEYTVSAFVGAVGDPLATDEATITVTPPLSANRVEGPDGEPVAGADVDLYVTDISVPDLDSDSPLERHVTEVTADTDGVFELPTTFPESDDELLVTARKGDWFTVARYDPDAIDDASDYGPLELDRQLLVDPTLVTTDSGDRFGVVSVWRYCFDAETDIFYVEVTNTNEYPQNDVWSVSESEPTGGGPAGGDFLFAFPDDEASIADDSAFADADPTGDGGVHVFARGPSGTGGDSLPEILHPLRDHVDVPLYASLRGQPDVALEPNWHTITPASSERSRRVEQRLRQGLSLTGDICSKVASVTCLGPGFLLDVLDTLTNLQALLERERRTARHQHTPNTPVAGGAVPESTFDVWEPDDVSLDQVPTQTAVAYQVPVRVETDDPITYSVQTEWARPFNDLGKFNGTFTTAPIDVAITSPVGTLTPGERYMIDIRFRNRSLEPRTITEATVETPTETHEISPGVELEPGETITFPGLAPFETPVDGELTLTVTATGAQGTTVTRTNEFPVNTGSVSVGADTNSGGASRQDAAEVAETRRGATAGESTNSDASREAGTTAESGGGFGIATAIAGTALACLRRVRDN